MPCQTHRSSIGISALALVALLVLGTTAGFAQQTSTRPRDTEPVTATNGVTMETLTQAKETLTDEELSEEVQKSIGGMLDAAMQSLQKMQTYRQEVQSYARDEEEAPQRIEKWKAAATQPATQPTTKPADLPLPEMESELNQRKIRLEELEKEYQQIQDQLQQRPTRLKNLPEVIAALGKGIEETQQKLKAVGEMEGPPQLRQARQWELETKLRAQRAELNARQKELATYETRGELLRERQALVGRRAADLRQQVKAWEQAVTEKRAAQAREKVKESRRTEQAAADKHPLIQQLAQTNTDLAEMGTGPGSPTRKVEAVREELAQVRKRLDDLSKTFGTLKIMVEKVGATDEIGQLLRNQRALLPDGRRIRQEMDTLQAEISGVQLRLIELDDRWSRLSDLDGYAKELVAEADPPVSNARREEVTAEVRSLLEARKATVNRLIAEFENYYKPLLELADSKRALATEAEQFSQFIDERVFWIPSTAPIGLTDVTRLWEGVRWLANPRSWASVAAALADDARENPLVDAALILAIGLAAVLRRKAASTARRINSHVIRDFPGSFLMTVWSLLLTFVLAAVWPAALAAVGWRLAGQGGGSPFAGAIGDGLMFAAMVWLPLGLLRQLCREKGVGETHFRWTPAVARQVRTSLVRPMFILLPLAFVVAAAEAQQMEDVRIGLGRAAAMAALVVLAVFLAGVLRPKGTICQDMSARRKSSWVAKLWLLWYPVAAAAPAALAVGAALGYYFTTVHLSVRLLGQVWWIIAVVIFNGLLLRMIFIGRRKLAAKEIEKRKQDLAEKEKKKEEEGEDAPEAIEAEPPRVDLAAVNEQTRRFLRYVVLTLLLVGTWMIWDDVLPALNLLGRLPLWGTITAAHLATGIVLIVLTTVAARNVPGMLEISILQRIHAEPGVRYAINALTQYTLFVVGFVLAFNAIGVGWSQVQWLVAAMTVGLGFGLQEIFANFVSGLIILFERPIRVGDVVTIGGVTGTVTRIRIRATTVVDWDRKELILPNKDFITGQLINWTLSDSVIRVVVPVGIAYGSDTRLARDLLLKVAETADRVLEDPAPQAFFMGFGDSCLDYELRVHVSGLQDYLRVKNDLHVLIDEEYRRHGIEIAFPQRDIHIRSVDGRIPLGVARDRDGGATDQGSAGSSDVANPPADPG